MRSRIGGHWTQRVSIPVTLAAALCVLVAAANAQPVGPQARLVAEIRIDGVSEQLSSVNPDLMLVGTDGRMMIWDAATSQVLAFNAAGKRITTFGRRGRGPGEFSANVTAGWLADTLWIYDMAQRRFSFLGPSNTLLRVYPYQPSADQAQSATAALGGSIVRLTPFALYRDGSMLASIQIRPPAREEAHASGAPLPTRFAMISSSGEVLRVVGTPPPNPATIRVPIRAPDAPPGAVLFAGATLPSGGTPLRAEKAVAPHGRRFAFLETDMSRSGGGGTFTLTVVRPTGDTVFMRAYRFDRIPMARSVEDSIVMSLRPELRDTARTRMKGQYSPVTAVVLGLDDSVWLQLQATASGVPCTLLDDRGEAVLTILLPRGADLVQASRTMIWAVERDEDDVPSVARYRVAVPPT